MVLCHEMKCAQQRKLFWHGLAVHIPGPENTEYFGKELRNKHDPSASQGGATAFTAVTEKDDLFNVLWHGDARE